MVFKILNTGYCVVPVATVILYKKNRITVMKSTAICPISSKKIDENVARLNATFTVLLIAISVFTLSYIPLIVLLIDFSLRGAELSKYSPLALLSKGLLKTLSIKSKPINAGPKIFAARVGVLFSAVALILNLFGFDTASLVVLSIFGICAFLEAAVGFCVACQIYPLVYKLFFHRKFQNLKV